MEHVVQRRAGTRLGLRGLSWGRDTRLRHRRLRSRRLRILQQPVYVRGLADLAWWRLVSDGYRLPNRNHGLDWQHDLELIWYAVRSGQLRHVLPDRRAGEHGRRTHAICGIEQWLYSRVSALREQPAVLHDWD